MLMWGPPVLSLMDLWGFDRSYPGIMWMLISEYGGYEDVRQKVKIGCSPGS